MNACIYKYKKGYYTKFIYQVNLSTSSGYKVNNNQINKINFSLFLILLKFLKLFTQSV